ncbi:MULTISPECIES: esterase-like activity of phytase family protein [unclassified Agarivorans]|uniref:esterase-like activity of phytase family protein n=1 Tax=unclassified Agarivorans TaxID=2636026 RepID=UPI0026E24371|nr:MULTISPECIES: esterase-like activity of phytase family protein [unclassified Agarivorans]MDO6688010.1 esterase-like activity of phytase family protein [Agarivorans sp. 3_MG-2023]MDO6715277.1 esterase-like activity of phytase family protein [Agarivorans sp. 2_MG-2023]MDO6763426.1 esterase-like activity of phytase family protein [Agarivorans sp. 1_MG-2023]
MTIRLILPITVLALTSLQTLANEVNTSATLPYQVLTTLTNGTEIRNGGYGSAMTAHPSLGDHFYALTDRGPNAKYQGPEGKGKIFPTPEYTPRIGLFRYSNGQITKVKEILLKDPQGNAVSGLPNPKGMGDTGEVAYANDKSVLKADPYGIDSEGLVALKDGGFWVSDEYGPHIVHYNQEGLELERINPFGTGTGGRKLPAVFTHRRANRGMEGLAITPDEKVLFGIMQSTLYNPSKKTITNKNLTRIVSFNIETGKTQQFIYQQEANNLSNSEIVALNQQQFLVIERDGGFAGGKGKKQAKYKRIYKIDLRQATDVSGDVTSPNGLRVNGKTLEQLSWQELANQGIKPVTKTLVSDLLVDMPTPYPHDKLEGLWLRNNNQLAVLNDDDFSVAAKGEHVIQKVLPANQSIDQNTLYILEPK